MFTPSSRTCPRRAIEAADDVHERRLAGARRTDDRQKLAILYLQVDAAEGVDALRAELVYL